MNGADLLALFPLELVLVPGEVVPLHIFEERYKLLVNERRDGASEFGIVLNEDSSVHEVGCRAVVAEVLEELDDGHLNILVEGRERFRLLELIEPDDPELFYLSGRVEPMDDLDDEPSDELVHDVLEVFRRMLVLMEVEQPRMPTGEGPLSFRLVAAVDFGTALKQQLLETLSERNRLETLQTVMETLIPRLELRKSREDAIRGNGKGY